MYYIMHLSAVLICTISQTGSIGVDPGNEGLQDIYNILVSIQDNVSSLSRTITQMQTKIQAMDTDKNCQQNNNAVTNPENQMQTGLSSNMESKMWSKMESNMATGDSTAVKSLASLTALTADYMNLFIYRSIKSPLSNVTCDNIREFLLKPVSGYYYIDGQSGRVMTYCNFAISSLDPSSTFDSCQEMLLNYKLNSSTLPQTVNLPPISGINKMAPCQFDQNLGWTVILRRQRNTSRDTDFQKSWSEYASEGIYVMDSNNNIEELFLALDYMHGLTANHPVRLRVEMRSVKEPTKLHIVEYSEFQVGSKETGYMLHVSGFNRLQGAAHDSLSSHSGMMFSAMDRDSDTAPSRHCSQELGAGGWWFADCYQCSLCGQHTSATVDRKGVVWRNLYNSLDVLDFVEMKITDW